MALHPGYVIQTDPKGRAEVLFDDGTEVKIDIRTVLELLASRSRPVHVIRGQVFLRARSELRINTPTADCHVFGTDFHLAVAEDGTTTLTVVEGAVEFSNPQGRVVVRDGLQSTARSGQPPTTPKPAVNLPNIIVWTDEVQPVALVLESVFVSQDPGRLQAEGKRAQALPPGSERWERLGDVQHDQGAFDARRHPQGLAEAEASYEQALAALGPAAPGGERARVEERLGQTWLEMGDIRTAQEWFGKSLGDDPKETAARVGRVMALLSEAAPDDAARSEAEAAVQMDGRSVAARTALALALIRLGRRDGAPGRTSGSGSSWLCRAPTLLRGPCRIRYRIG
jgi:hypothetical protein